MKFKVVRFLSTSYYGASLHDTDSC